MIRHVVLFRFRADISAAQRDAFHAAASGLVDLIPAVDRAVAGPALGLQPGEFDYVLMLDMADAAAFAAYKAHPAHLRLIEDHVRPCVEASVRAQVRLDAVAPGSR